MTVYKASINGEEHEFAGNWWGGWWSSSEYTAGDWIDITNGEISNTWVLSINGQGWNVEINTEETVYSWDENVDYEIRVRTDVPAIWTNNNVITIRKVL